MSTECFKETQLSVGNLGRLKLLLQPVSAYWVSIADQLGMTSQVAIIRSTPDNTNPPACLRDLLHRWLNREHPSPTLEALCQALRDDDEIIGGCNVAGKLEKEFQSQRDAADPLVHVEKVHEIVDRKVEDLTTEKRVREIFKEEVKTIQQENSYPFSVENIKFLNVLKKIGKLQGVSHHVTSCEVLIEEHCVKVVGTPEGCRQAKQEIDLILERSAKMTESLPEFVSSTVGEYATKCMETNEGVLVLPHEKEVLFIAEDREHCKKAVEWMKENAYPLALQFQEGGRFFLTTSRLPGSTPVEVKAAPEAIRTKYLHPPDHYMIKLKQVIQGSLSWDIDTVRDKMTRILEQIEPYQTKLKVGYEARFGHVLWKVYDQARFRIDHFRSPHSKLESVFCTGVDQNIQKVLSMCSDPIEDSVKLLDPLRIKVTRCDGTEANCVAVIEELEEGRFVLNNVFYDQRAKGTPQFDIVLPDRKYDVSIAPNFAPAAKQYVRIGPNFAPAAKQYVDEVYEIAEVFSSSIHRRSDGTLWMKVRGPNYHVRYLRQKKQTQYKWKANEKWTLAEYIVQEFEITEKEIVDEKWSMDEEVQLELTEPKTEIELWNQKWFGDFAPQAHFTKGHYADVKSTRDMRIPKEDTLRKGSRWSTAEMMKEFDEFVAAAVEITDLLTQLRLR